MSPKWRTLDRGVLRDVGLVCLADGVVGLSFGAIAVSHGLHPWVPIVLSLTVFAGAAQFVFVDALASGNVAAAVAAACIVNVRHLPYGIAIGDALGERGSVIRRLTGSHIVTDESTAFAASYEDPVHRRAAFWLCGAGIFVVWNIGTAAGVLLGDTIGDTDALGLDAAFPAVLLALALPSIRRASTVRAVLVGVAVALATTPWLPAGVPVLLSLIALAARGRPVPL